MFYYIVSRNRATTAQPFHLLPLRFPPKLVLLPLKALMFKVSFADGASLLEKLSSAESTEVAGRVEEGRVFKVIL